MRSPGLAGRLSLPVVLLVVTSLALLGALTVAVTYHGRGAAAQSADLRMATMVRWLGVLLLAGAGASALAGVRLSRSLTRQPDGGGAAAVPGELSPHVRA